MFWLSMVKSLVPIGQLGNTHMRVLICGPHDGYLRTYKCHAGSWTMLFFRRGFATVTLGVERRGKLPIQADDH